MGQTDNNINVIIHRCNESPPVREVFVARHLGSMSIDSKSPPASITAWRAYRDALLGDEDEETIHALGVSAWGTWYETHVESVPAVFTTLKAAITDGCGS